MEPNPRVRNSITYIHCFVISFFPLHYYRNPRACTCWRTVAAFVYVHALCVFGGQLGIHLCKSALPVSLQYINSPLSLRVYPLGEVMTSLERSLWKHTDPLPRLNRSDSRDLLSYQMLSLVIDLARWSDSGSADGVDEIRREPDSNRHPRNTRSPRSMQNQPQCSFQSGDGLKNKHIHG